VRLAQVLIRDKGAKDEDEDLKPAIGGGGEGEYSMSVKGECVVENEERRKEVKEGYEVLKKLESSNFDVRFIVQIIPFTQVIIY
jgi:hypothetical protein